MGEAFYVPAVKAADIAPEASVAVRIDGVSLLICRSRSEYFAVSNRCSHANEPLECGRIRAGWVACPVHGARFELSTGRALNLPATAPIEVFPTRLNGDWIEVAVRR